MKAMVLCAGLGTRLRPLTHRIPKPLVPAPGEPLVFHTLRGLARSGVSLCVINLHHLPDQVRAAAGHAFEGMDIAYSEEPDILGPTGSLRKVVDTFGRDPFFVVNGDINAHVDFAAMMDFHKRHGASLTMAAKTGVPESPLNALGFDAHTRLRQVWDQPAWPGPALERGINTGVFIYEPDLIRNFVPARGFYGFRDDFIPALFAADVPVHVFPYRGYWSDIGNADAYLEFLRDALDGRVPGLAGGHFVSGDARIHSGAHLAPPCYIASGCMVHDGARIGPYAVLGAHAIAARGAVARHCLIAPHEAVPEAAHIEHEIFL